MMTIDTNALLDEFINFLSPRAPTPVQHFLLSSEDFQRIETISSLYQKRIELGKYLDYFLFLFFTIRTLCFSGS